MNGFRIVKQIGEGAYGEVFEAVEKSTGEPVAIKKFKDNKDDLLAQREMQTAIMVCSDNIVQCYSSFRHQNLFHLVFEYVNGPNLLTVLQANPDGLERHLVKRLMFELCNAVYVCHNSQIIHRDIKPENCLVTRGTNQLKLCDFGCATVMPAECSSYEYVATRWYRPPEFELRSTSFTLAADIWSIGCVMCECVDGYPVFPGESSADQLHIQQQMLGPLGKVKGATKEFRGQSAKVDYTKNRTDSLATKYRAKVDASGIDLLERMLQLDPEARLSAKECVDHPYFSGMAQLHNDDDGIDEMASCGAGSDSCESVADMIADLDDGGITTPVHAASLPELPGIVSTITVDSEAFVAEDYGSETFVDDDPYGNDDFELESPVKPMLTARRGSNDSHQRKSTVVDLRLNHRARK